MENYKLLQLRKSALIIKRLLNSYTCSGGDMSIYQYFLFKCSRAKRRGRYLTITPIETRSTLLRQQAL